MQKKGTYEICVRKTFQAHHNLKYANDQRDEIHTHLWIIEAYIENEKLDQEGLVLDFRKVDTMLDDIIDKIKDKYINEVEPFTRMNPSAENLCRWFYEQLKAYVMPPCHLAKVVLKETQNYSASYAEKNTLF